MSVEYQSVTTCPQCDRVINGTWTYFYLLDWRYPAITKNFVCERCYWDVWHRPPRNAARLRVYVQYVPVYEAPHR